MASAMAVIPPLLTMSSLNESSLADSAPRMYCGKEGRRIKI